MCFVWISEQKTIISPYNINWLVFITETECVYCAVRTGYLNLIQVNFLLNIVPWLRQLIAGLTLRRLGFNLRSVHVKYVVDRVAMGQANLHSLRLPCQ